MLPHDDGTFFSDGTGYAEGAIHIEAGATAALGSSSIVLRLVAASGAEGIRFSYQHALYETGPVIEQLAADLFRVPIFPAIRQAIPDGAWLEVDSPTCLCRLADDRGMDLELSPAEIDSGTVEFVEAVDFWNDLALESV